MIVWSIETPTTERVEFRATREQAWSRFMDAIRHARRGGSYELRHLGGDGEGGPLVASLWYTGE